MLLAIAIFVISLGTLEKDGVVSVASVVGS
jgi:hypothetical protein